ncbi:membrane protein [Streptomyces spiroverticillatus]|uniref:Membrane protein n=1 Tax=Streptomyces finlayi TaxID=67296 RepID=A0A918WSR4_9ACTN|nr:membrane protein [Streptomyces spiroverticillatus]GHC78966.1 membrane protein [Streptomyces finlayi]
MVVVFVLALLLLLGGVHWYVWKRVVRDTAPPGARGRRIRRTGAAALTVLPLLSVTAFLSGRLGFPFWLQQTLAWPGYLWLALLLYLTLALLATEAARPFLLRSHRRPRTPASAPADAPVPDATKVPTPITPAAPETPKAPKAPEAPAPPTPPTRRLFVSRTLAATAAVAATGTVAYGTHSVLQGPRTTHVTVPLPHLPRRAHGFRIAVVSDIHLGPILGRAHTERIVDAVNAAQPDLIAIVGDMVDGTVEDLGPAAEPLRRLRAKHGQFFVTGNHEYYAGAAPWLAHIRELGLHPLENDRVEIAGFDLAGVNDVGGEAFGQGPDFTKALGDRDRSRASVLLAHQPVQIHEAVRHGVGLQLSGHTHGGQLWPGNLIAALANPTVAGLEKYGDTQLYVSRGAGAWGPPVRVGARSDITVVRLASLQA